MTEHTKGPWEAIPRHEHDGWGIASSGAKDGAGWMMYFDGASEDEMDANARLIAAAPELLDALRYLGDMPLSGTTKQGYGETIANVRRIAREAIAKAE